ncbi:MAG: SUMF1/EgtB/PvdO family nonheme iron enzyme [Planctomycetales bacterium]|nr:SUMF1/EgtB/PvdO family nonheme iron enzyme [Planctomycetales bacterium]
MGWNEAARFTNWLNTSTGGFAAYNFAGATGVNDPIVTQAGGLSPYGIMGLGGNVWECEETSNDLNESSSSSVRGVRGGNWSNYYSADLSSSARLNFFVPADEHIGLGFRVASGTRVPSPLSSGEKVAARPDEGVCPPPEEWQLPLILFLLKVLRAAHCDSWFCRLCC